MKRRRKEESARIVTEEERNKVAFCGWYGVESWVTCHMWSSFVSSWTITYFFRKAWHVFLSVVIVCMSFMPLPCSICCRVRYQILHQGPTKQFCDQLNSYEHAQHMHFKSVCCFVFREMMMHLSTGGAQIATANQYSFLLPPVIRILIILRSWGLLSVQHSFPEFQVNFSNVGFSLFSPKTQVQKDAEWLSSIQRCILSHVVCISWSATCVYHT